jgi:hypothetical protein
MSLLYMQASDCTHCREIQEPAFLNSQTINVLSAQRLNGEFVVKYLKSVLLTLSITQRCDHGGVPPNTARHLVACVMIFSFNSVGSKMNLKPSLLPSTTVVKPSNLPFVRGE